MNRPRASREPGYAPASSRLRVRPRAPDEMAWLGIDVVHRHTPLLRGAGIPAASTDPEASAIDRVTSDGNPSISIRSTRWAPVMREPDEEAVLFSYSGLANSGEARAFQRG